MPLKKIALEEHWHDPELWASAVGSNSLEENISPVYHERLVDTQRRVEEMDRNGIEVSILSLTQPGIEGVSDRKLAITSARKVNDYLVNRLLARHPDRFKAFACVPLQDPQAAAKELERAVRELGCVGAMINGYSNVGDDAIQYLDEPQVRPFWKTVSDLNVPVYLHPRSPHSSQQRIYEGYPGLTRATWAFGIETATHAVRLMLSGLFDEYPNLTVILGHLGEGLPYMLPRLDHRLRHVPPGSCGNHTLPPSVYFSRNFFITTAGTMRTQTLVSAMSEISSDRILFSTDYPFESMEEITSWFDQCSIAEIDREKIGSLNARKLFQL